MIDFNDWYNKLVQYSAGNASSDTVDVDLLSLTPGQKVDIIYLRTRHRWTPELEIDLIRKIVNKESVNIMEFGCTPETGSALMKTVSKMLSARGIHSV